MTTMQERPTLVGAPRTSSPWLIVGMVVIGLLLGLLGGWMLFGSSDMIAADGSAITDRQAEMSTMIDDAFVAWQDSDVEAVLSYYTERANFVARGIEYGVEDGELADYVTSFTRSSAMEPVGPDVFIDENTVVSFHTFDGQTFMNVFDFTPSGEVLIARHEVRG